MLQDDPGGVAVRVLAADSVAAGPQVVGERLELVAVGSAAAAVAALDGVQQHQELTLDPTFFHRSLLTTNDVVWQYKSCHFQK